MSCTDTPTMHHHRQRQRSQTTGGLASSVDHLRLATPATTAHTTLETTTTTTTALSGETTTPSSPPCSPTSRTSATSPVSSPDSFLRERNGHHQKTHKTHTKMGKLWSTVKHNTKKVLATPHTMAAHAGRRRSSTTPAGAQLAAEDASGLQPRHLNFDADHPGGGMVAGSSAEGDALRLDGLGAKSLQRKRAEIERMKQHTSQQLQRELLKHQKQLILTSEMIADLHKTLGALRKCVSSMRGTIPAQAHRFDTDLAAATPDAEGSEPAGREGGEAAEGAASAALGHLSLAVADQDLPAVAARLADLASAAKARTAAAADAARARRRSSVSSQQAKGEDLQGGGGGEEPDTPPELREVQGRILGLCAGVLGDENASAGEVSAATACLSLVGGPAKARRHLLSRRSRTLATAAADFRGASPRDVVPSAGAYLSCFLAECSGCAADCEKTFGQAGCTRWSSDYMCWLCEEAGRFCAELERGLLGHISRGGGIREVAELVVAALVESSVAGRGSGISLTVVLEEKLASMLASAIGVFVPRVGQDVALQATSEIAQFAQLLEGAGEQKVTFLRSADGAGAAPAAAREREDVVPFDGLRGSTGMISSTLADLLEDVRPLLSPSLRACISSRMFFLFKQFVATISDSVRRYSTFISTEAKEGKGETLARRREEILGNVREAADRILEVRGEASMREEMRAEVDGFARVFSEAFCLS